MVPLGADDSGPGDVSDTRGYALVYVGLPQAPGGVTAGGGEGRVDGAERDGLASHLSRDAHIASLNCISAQFDELCRPPDYAECAGPRVYGCWVVGIIRAVTSFIMRQARQCARDWSAKTLVTAMRSLLRFLHVEGMIPAPLVGRGPDGGGLEAVRLPHPDGDTTGSQARIMPTTHTPHHCRPVRSPSRST
jgi:hypothetical protein